MFDSPFILVAFQFYGLKCIARHAYILIYLAVKSRSAPYVFAAQNYKIYATFPLKNYDY